MRKLTPEQKKETVQKIVRLLAGLDYSTAQILLYDALDVVLEKSVVTLDENAKSDFEEFVTRLQNLMAHSLSNVKKEARNGT